LTALQDDLAAAMPLAERTDQSPDSVLQVTGVSRVQNHHPLVRVRYTLPGCRLECTRRPEQGIVKTCE
jgi:hypothetical protein